MTVLCPVSWRREALSGCVSLPRTPALALAAPRVPEEPQQPGCSLSLLWGRQNSVYSHSKQIPRCGLPSCHVFLHEIPDLVCCVFLKAHPLPPKTSAREGETFLVELPVFEPVSDYAPLCGPDTPFSLPTAFLRAVVEECASRLGWFPQTAVETEAEGGHELPRLCHLKI